MHTQVLILVIALNKLVEAPPKKMRDIVFDTVRYFEEKHAELCREIEQSGVITDEQKEFVLAKAKAYIERNYGE